MRDTKKNRYGINFTLMEYYITIITIYIYTVTIINVNYNYYYIYYIIYMNGISSIYIYGMKYGYAWVCTVWVVCTSKWMGLSDFFRCAINSCFNRGAWLSNGFKGTLCSDKPARWSAGEVANYCSWVTSSYKWLTDDRFSLNINIMDMVDFRCYLNQKKHMETEILKHE